jgi:hypothetical protein
MTFPLPFRYEDIVQLFCIITTLIYIQAKTKVAKAEKALAKFQEFLSPAELPSDLETVTDEERFLLRRIGLKMKAFLMLGTPLFSLYICNIACDEHLVTCLHEM